MNPSHPDPDQPSTRFSLLRPAVSPRTAASPAAAGEKSAAPLGPFSRAWPEARASIGETSGRKASPEKEPVEAAPPPLAQEPAAYALEPEADDDLPWMTRGALWQDAPDAPAEEPRSEEESLPGIPVIGYETESVEAEADASWLEFDAQVDEAAAAVEEIAAEAPPAPEPSRSLGDELLAPPEWEYGYDAAPGLVAPPPAAEPAFEPELEAEPVSAPVSPAAPAAANRPALEDVAARLERIARALRGSSPAELLANTDDPLQLLIAGYALGLADAARHPGEVSPPRDRG
jgi:hypothetical protein